MNWTGGRLQRHSRDSSALQKQRFAKPRSRRFHDAQLPEIFQNLSQSHGLKSQQRTLGGSYGRRDQSSKDLHGRSNTSGYTSDEPPQALSRLDRIKRQLLRTNDWAAIGVTRPVKMSFTPTEELERFGKRRKLTEADHNRLVSSGGRISRPGPRERRERASSEFGTIGNVDIQIHRLRADPASSIAGYYKGSNESSQPMLLDREESAIVDQSSSTDGEAYGPSRGRTISSQLLLSSQNRPRQSPSFAPSDTLLPVESVFQDIDQRYANRSSPHPHLQPSRSPMRLVSRTPSLHHPIPQFPRRFTIDDQIASELEAQSSREMRDNAQVQLSDTAGSYATSECSSEKIRNEHGLGCTAAGAQSTSSNQFPGWLPEPKHHIQRFVGQEDPRANTSSALTMSETIDCKQPAYGAELGSRAGSYTSSVKIFGQSIRLEETVEDTQFQHRPVYNTNPRFSPPQGYMTPNPQHTQVQEDINPEICMSNKFVGRAVNQAYNDRPRRDFEIHRNTPFTPFRQGISRQPVQSNVDFLNDVAEQQTVYGQHLPSSASLKQKATHSRQQNIADLSSDPL